MQPRKLQCCIWRDSIKPSLRFSWFLCVLCFQRQSFFTFILLYCSWCCAVWRPSKVSPYIIKVQVIFYFLWDHWAHPGYLDNRIPFLSLKTALGGICSLANYSVAYEETQSNRVSDFRDFCVFFVSIGNPFIRFYLLTVLRRWSRCWYYSLLLCGLFYEAICFMFYLVFFFFFVFFWGFFFLCFVVVVFFFSPFSIVITSLGEEWANLSAICTFVRFALVWFVCFLFPLVSGKGCGLWMWHFLDFSLTFLGWLWFFA